MPAATAGGKLPRKVIKDNAKPGTIRARPQTKATPEPRVPRAGQPGGHRTEATGRMEAEAMHATYAKEPR